MGDLVTFPKQTLWVEKYRPTTMADCILTKSVAADFASMVKSGHIENSMLIGKPGTGKTTAAKALCNDIGLDHQIVNASSDRTLDLIRQRISSFASTTSMTGKGKCFILDEADRLPPGTQAALNNATESFSKNCAFLMTANYPSRIIPALHSRFPAIDFDIRDDDDKARSQMEFFHRCAAILKNEGVEFDQKVLIKIISAYSPDNRLILGKLQQYARRGPIDEGILLLSDEMSIEQLIDAMKVKKYKDILVASEDLSQSDTSGLYEKMYRALKGYMVPTSIPDAIMIINDYQRYDTIVPSKSLHITSMAVELMGLEFK